MPTDLAGFQPAGPVLIRASTRPTDLDVTPPDLSAPIQDALTWLTAQWTRRDVRDALTTASPDLAARVDQIIDPHAPRVEAKDVRRAVTATATYLHRWKTRTTPFGLFAAVGTADVGPAAATFGTRHRAVARADADWLAGVVDELERHRGLRRRLMVVADNTAFVRDGRLIIAARPQHGQRSPGPLRETSIAYTPAVRLALSAAVEPIRFDHLAESLSGRAPHVAPAVIETLLHGLVDGGFLITGLRTPMTTVDGLAHVLYALTTVSAADLADLAPVCAQLSEIHTELTRHNTQPEPSTATQVRDAITAAMTEVVPDAAHQLAVDLRLDGTVAVPPPVLNEVARAADVLLRVGTRPFGSMAWLEYHARFRDRYGPGALVPVQDLVADSGLGYPAGYLGAPQARPVWRVLTDRDVYLTTLIQQANLDHVDEIILTDADIDTLTVGDHTTIVAPARIEVGFAVHAVSPMALDQGEFTVQITAAPRTPTSMAGRFAHLLDPPDRHQLARSFVAPGDGELMVVQVSFPPRRVHNENVVRVGRLLPAVVALSEHPDGDVIRLSELAVTADAEQMYLVHAPSGRRVVPYLPHALDTIVQTPPLARFLAEVADSRSAVFGPFDHGAVARTLRYVPRIRYGRAVLAPARWLVTPADIGPIRQDDPTWEANLNQWRHRWRVPNRIIFCQTELRLPLDLDRPFDRALLRARLAGTEQIELREDLSIEGGWLGRPAEFLVALTRTTPPTRPVPVTQPAGQTSHPGASDVVHAKLSGNPARFDQLLTDHLAPLADSLARIGVRHWWISRRRDTIRAEAEPSVSLFLRLTDASAYGPVAARLGECAADLARRSLPADLVFTAHVEHPGRYGHGPALTAAEHVFATDTTAALCQLRLVEQANVSGQALAAASMANLAAAFTTEPTSGLRALLACLHNATSPAERAITDLARRLADPTDNHHVLRTMPGGEAVLEAWQTRAETLRAYHETLAAQREPITVLRTLLHEHHVRALGVDPDFERTTNHAARAAAHRHLALAEAQ